MGRSVAEVRGQVAGDADRPQRPIEPRPITRRLDLRIEGVHSGFAKPALGRCREQNM